LAILIIWRVLIISFLSMILTIKFRSDKSEMKKRLKWEFVNSYFASTGYKLLSRNYVNAKTYLNAICSKGHNISITWDAFRSGRRCAICSKRKVTIGDVIVFAKKNGYVLLSNKYINAKSKLEFECPDKHVFQMNWNNFKNCGRRCPECQKLRRWTYEEVETFFQDRGYKLLSTRFQNVSKKLIYLCPNGHESFTTFDKFKNSQHGCDHCGGSKRLELSKIKKEFLDEGLVLLEQKYVNAKTPLEFRCACGNIDKVTYKRFRWAGERKNPKRKCSTCMIPEWHNTLNEEERIKQRKFPEYYVWVKKVKEAYNYSCNCCEYKGIKIVAHHLDGYSWCKEKRTDLDNGIVLCHTCHKHFHTIYGYKNNTKLQYLDFRRSKVWKAR
jgi:hypothetical protein